MEPIVAIIGAGYVGMHIAHRVAGSGIEVIAYDLNDERIQELSRGFDKYLEFNDLKSTTIRFTNKLDDIADANYFIAAVPTPINKHLVPNVGTIKEMTKSISRVLKKEDVIIFESTVYPGATEELVIPALEKLSGLKCGVDFYVGYSPERIVPQDNEHNLSNVVKVISATTTKGIEKIKYLYQDCLGIKLHIAPSIKTAEACKLIENIQRDVNIALMNEFSEIMAKMNVSMRDVLKAASTKWNFLPFQPGFVGGHCIPVDPYYLIYQANQYHLPSYLISTARQVNEQFINFISNTLIYLMQRHCHAKEQFKVAILGISYKPNVSDIRHSLSIDLYKILQNYNYDLYAYDPYVSQNSVELNWVNWENLPKCHAIILAQGHDEFLKIAPENFIDKLKENAVFIDIPGLFSEQDFTSKAITYWCL